MFDEDQPPPRKDNNRKNQEPPFNWKGLVLLAVSALFIAWAFISMGTDKSHMGRSPKIHFSEFQQLLQSDKIICTPDKPLYLVKDPTNGEEYLEGYYRKYSSLEGKGPGEAKFTTSVNVALQKDSLNRMIEDYIESQRLQAEKVLRPVSEA
jgi:hypothetical protein